MQLKQKTTAEWRWFFVSLGRDEAAQESFYLDFTKLNESTNAIHIGIIHVLVTEETPANVAAPVVLP